MDENNAPALLEARDLTVELAADARIVRVLDGVSLTLRPGDFVDVTGPSGAGKTTLLRALAHLLPNRSGGLWLKGKPSEEFDPAEWRMAVAMLPQRPALLPGLVLQNLTAPWRLKVRHGATPPDSDTLRREMDRLALSDVALDRDVTRLSVGQQARVALLRLLLTQPVVLLLDEPDAALDPHSASAVSEALRAFAAGGGAILRVRHRESDGSAHTRLKLAGGALTREEGDL